MIPILWLEDVKRQVEPFVQELTHHRCEVDIRSNCNEFLSQLSGLHRYRAVIMDLWVPVGHGKLVPTELHDDQVRRGIWVCKQTVACVQRLREEQRPAVIVLSGNLDPDTRNVLQDEIGIASANLHEKPVALEKFIEFVLESCKPAWQRGQG